MNDMEMLLGRIAALESRVADLERQMGTQIDERAAKEAELFEEHGKYVTKAEAARILEVNRVTVYNMIADGRLTTSYGGARVTVASIAAFITQQKRMRAIAHKGKAAKEVRHAD